jgi:hypothetical protein
MASHTFSGDLWEHELDGPESWHFVTLPLYVADDLLARGRTAPRLRSVRVQARIGSAIWHTSLSRTRATALSC